MNIYCPVCSTEYDMSDYWTDGSKTFEFECSCGADVGVFVEYEPRFYVTGCTKREEEKEE